MANILGPELKDIQDKFIDSLAEGGMAAVEKMVHALAVEEAAAQTLSDTVTQMQTENLLDLRDFDEWEEGYEIVEFTDAIRNEHILTIGRRSLALTMLYELKGRAA